MIYAFPLILAYKKTCLKIFLDIGGYYEYDGHALYMQGKTHVSAIRDAPVLSSDNHASDHVAPPWFRGPLPSFLPALISKRLEL